MENRIQGVGSNSVEIHKDSLIQYLQYPKPMAYRVFHLVSQTSANGLSKDTPQKQTSQLIYNFFLKCIMLVEFNIRLYQCKYKISILKTVK